MKLSDKQDVQSMVSLINLEQSYNALALASRERLDLHVKFMSLFQKTFGFDLVDTEDLLWDDEIADTLNYGIENLSFMDFVDKIYNYINNE